MLESPATATVEVPVFVTDECPVLDAGALVPKHRPVSVISPLRLGGGSQGQTRQQAQHGHPEDSAFAEPHLRILLAL